MSDKLVLIEGEMINILGLTGNIIQIDGKDIVYLINNAIRIEENKEMSESNYVYRYGNVRLTIERLDENAILLANT